MFHTKQDVDKHVENCLKKINKQSERNQRCIAFAKLYYNIKEYEQANRYVLDYLQVQPSSTDALNLLGNTLEKLGKTKSAVEAYRKSLDVNPGQTDAVFKVCELLMQQDVNIDVSDAKKICERAQSIDPERTIIHRLKARLIALETKNPDEVTELLLKELETRPLSVDIRIRLLRHLVDNNKVREAYQHAFEIEHKHLSCFLDSLQWYETVAEVLVLYQRSNSLNQAQLTWQYWMLLVAVLDKFVALSLDESVHSRTVSECVAALMNFDQNFKIAAENLHDCPEKQLVEEFFNHYTGQICYHLTTLLYKQAKNDAVKYKDAVNISLPLLIAANHFRVVDLNSLWVQHCSETNRRMVQRWHKEAAFRCTQVGFMLLAIEKDQRVSVIERIAQTFNGLWRELTFKKLFVTREQQIKIKTSYFVTTNRLIDLPVRLPERVDLQSLAEVAQLVHPDSLHHYIWLGLNSDLTTFSCPAFHGLQYSVKNLTGCAPESLSMLDVLAFVFSAVYCAQSHIEENKYSIYHNADKPAVLPASVCETFGTNNQANWLRNVYKTFTNQYGSNLGKLRLSIVSGLECVRCIGNHGLDVRLLVQLAKLFGERAQKLTKQSEIEYNNARAEIYWKAALPILDKYRNNQTVSYAKQRLFEYKMKQLSQHEVSQFIDDGRLFIACQMMKRKEYENAIAEFETLRDPYASFYQALTYKLLAEKEVTQIKENVTSEMRSKNIILLTKARDCLYLTLDRLRDPNVDRKHPLNKRLGTEIEKIERILSRIDPDCTNRNEFDGVSEENLSSVESDNYNLFMHTSNNTYANGNYTTRLDGTHNHSTPFKVLDHSRREARPSPERLDAQLRQLIASKDATLSHILDQNKIMVESHKTLVEELKSFRDAVCGLTSTVNELKIIKDGFEDIKTIKRSVDELKSAVDELQNFRNVTDLVYEMRREIQDLKRDTTKIKSNQLSDEDLYALDEEYGTDYASMNPNVSALPPQSLYTNIGRLPAATGNSLAYAPPIYPGIYPMYPYPGLGLTPGGALSFGPDTTPLTDFRTVGGLPQNLNQSVQNQNVVYPSTNQLPQPYVGQSLLTTNALAQTTFTQPPPPFQQQPPPHQVSSFFKDASATIPSPLTTQATIGLPPAIIGDSNKAAPVNVVITSSDPLPSSKVITTPQILSVTIPPQHIKGNQQKVVHNYQITLPVTTATINSTSIAPPIALNQSPIPVTTQNLLSNITTPVYSSIIDNKSPANKNNALGFQIEKSLSQSFNKTAEGEYLNKSNVSSTSQDEYDPCPDFKPIIPLPDEVPINSGEEDEDVLFCERAKLFRFCDREWKERGIGDLKLLKHKKSKKVRLVMRRDQVHKICANHYVTNEMKLLPMNQSQKSYIWGANDFSDGALHVEKFCVQFKTPELAKKFYNEFEKAKIVTHAHKVDTATATQTSLTNLGGFTFTSTPTFKPKDDKATPNNNITVADTKAVSSPFASFSFGNKDTPPSDKSLPTSLFPTFSFSATTTSDSTTPKQTVLFSTPTKDTTDGKTSFSLLGSTPKDKVSEIVKQTSFVAIDKPKSPSNLNESASNAEEFEPTVEFKPVIPLPDLVDIKTGEENAQVLFESKAKLLRFDKVNKEWKERGVGIMKILKENTVRLVMRRDQVHKVCCNHQLLKNMEFSRMKSSGNAMSWYAQDFSEGVFQSEMFAIKFKSAETLNEFDAAIALAKDMLDDNNAVIVATSKSSDKKIKPIETPPATTGWGDKFKLKSGSWECKNCYIVNDAKSNHCVACETAKNDTVPKKQPDSQFCFGVTSTASNTSGFSFGATTTTAKTTLSTPNTTAGFGSAFKPKEGSWECEACLVRNDKENDKCVSCETSRTGVVASKPDVTSSKLKGVDLSIGDLKFNFGVPSAAAPAPPTPTQTTEAAATTGVATPPSATFGGLSTVQFGSTLKWECKPCNITNTGFTCSQCKRSKDDVAVSPTTKPANTVSFNFGATTKSTAVKSFEFTPSTESSKGFSFSLTTSTPLAATKQDKEEEIVFGSPHKAGFEFTPRSPRRQSGGQTTEDEAENSYYEEEEDNIYFKPVIPLPDKITITTGEENEEVVYSQRAKLFRHVDGEWKERGIGDVKILRQRESKKLRVLMRREQIHKICLNHMLTKEIKYTQKDFKTWLFNAPDYSEAEIEYHNFCLRFKSEEIAQQFKKAVDNALKNITQSESLVASGNKKEDDSDVEFVSETQVTAEEEAEAKRLGLHPKFMAYRQLPDCTCEQCKKEDEMLRNVVTSTTSTPKSADGLNATKFFSFGSLSSQSTTTFATPTNMNTVSFGEKQQPPHQSETLKSLLLKPSALSTNNQSVTSTPPSQTNALFSSPQSTPSTGGSIFGNASQTAKMFSTPPTMSGSIFGGGATSTTASTGSIFGNAGKTPTGNMFAASPAAATSTTSSIFGTAATTTTPSIFGTPTTSTTTSSIFGSAAPPPTFGTNKPVFSQPATTTVSTTTAKPFTGNLFGSTQKFETSIFGGAATNTHTTGESKSSEESPLTLPKSFEGLSFANLAASQNVFASSTSTEQSASSKNVFANLGAGDPVFSASKATTPSMKKSSGSGDKQLNESNDDDTSGANYDPYYEPIVPLPDEIIVKTGEEEEEVLFVCRAKLYRFGNKEWKERGVGDFKILMHPTKHYYRMLLRRELVHKIVLNQLIKLDMNIAPLSTSQNTWMWAGMNYYDDEYQLEQLAVRFKTEDISNRFKKTVDECMTKLREAGSSHTDIPTTIEHNVSDEEVEEDDEEDSVKDEEDDERDTLFSNECVFSESSGNEWHVLSENGYVQIYYDDEMNLPRITVHDNDECISNTIFREHREIYTRNDEYGVACEWIGEESIDDEEPYERKLKLSFKDSETADACVYAIKSLLGE